MTFRELLVALVILALFGPTCAAIAGACAAIAGAWTERP